MNRLYSFLSNRYFGITEKVMGLVIPLGRKKFSRLSPGLVEKEGKLGDLKAGEEGAIIGSGPLPFTAVLFVQCFDVFLYSVDKSVTACAVAKRFLKKCFSNEKVTVVNTRGEHFDKEVDFAFLTLCAAPKTKLIESLFQKHGEKDGFRVIARVPAGVHRKRFDDIDRLKLEDRYHIEELFHHTDCVFKTVLVTRKNA